MWVIRICSILNISDRVMGTFERDSDNKYIYIQYVEKN